VRVLSENYIVYATPLPVLKAAPQRYRTRSPQMDVKGQRQGKKRVDGADLKPAWEITRVNLSAS